IESLEAINIGNIILNDEIYRDTDKECEWIDTEQKNGQQARIALIRRDSVDTGTHGGLHDLDMAAYIPKMTFEIESSIPPLYEQTEAGLALVLIF
ncbi:hypothetical protein C0995_006732, partial [Termitomyces sp. Mi166